VIAMPLALGECGEAKRVTDPRRAACRGSSGTCGRSTALLCCIIIIIIIRISPIQAMYCCQSIHPWWVPTATYANNKTQHVSGNVHQEKNKTKQTNKQKKKTQRQSTEKNDKKKKNKPKKPPQKTTATTYVESPRLREFSRIGGPASSAGGRRKSPKGILRRRLDKNARSSCQLCYESQRQPAHKTKKTKPKTKKTTIHPAAHA
jgi:hypothetical protein